jgi:NAD+ diphosphatase
VEPGESAEQCVVREVAEEVGAAVADVTYVGSQPWPFPASLMLAFRARVAPGPLPTLTPDPAELADACWFTRAELRSALSEQTLRIPPPVSVARRLIDSWLDETNS